LAAFISGVEAGRMLVPDLTCAIRSNVPIIHRSIPLVTGEISIPLRVVAHYARTAKWIVHFTFYISNYISCNLKTNLQYLDTYEQ